MHQDQACILILEDDKFTSKLIYSALGQHFPEACLITAYDLDQARILAQHLDIDIVLSDVYLPDGHGMDFVFDLMMGKPLLEVVVISSAQQPEIMKRTKDMGTVHFIPKPVDVENLLGIIRRGMGKLAKPTKKTAQFKARLSQLSPLDLVQMKCLSNASEVLEFIPGKGLEGHLYFRNGRIIHAETAGILGAEAFNRIIAWEGGEVNELPLPDNVTPTITSDWQSLLMNAAHALDMRDAPPDAPEQDEETPSVPKPASIASPMSAGQTPAVPATRYTGETMQLDVPVEAAVSGHDATPMPEVAAPEPEPPVAEPPAPRDPTGPMALELDELLITNSKGGVRASFGMDTNQAHEFAAYLAAMRPEVHNLLQAYELGPLDKMEFANSTRGAMVQLDANGSVLALGPTRALHEKRLMKNAIFMMEQLLATS